MAKSELKPMAKPKANEIKSKKIKKPMVASKVKEIKIPSTMTDEYNLLRRKLAKEKNKNLEEIPKITKIVVTCCAANFFRDKKAFESIREQLEAVTLQAVAIIKAKQSVSSFTLREGMELAYKATLRGLKMMHFLHRLIHFGWLNDRNFYGVSVKAISGNKKGGYSLNVGLKDISIFPEVQKSLDKYVGIGITICTTAKTISDCRELLEGLNIPFSDMKVKEL